MLLEKMVKANELEVIKKVVDGLKKENVAKVFTTYMYEVSQNEKDLSIIEKQFVDELKGQTHELCADLTMGKITDFEAELRSVYIDGHYSFKEDDYCNLYDMIEYYDDTYAFPIIKKFMQDAYDRVVAKLNETEKTRKEKRIASLEIDIKRYQESIEAKLTELSQLR